MNFELIRNINFHDAKIIKCEKMGNDLILEIQDGLNDNLFFKFRFKNVEIYVNDIKKYNNYIIDTLNNINVDGLDIFCGDYGEDEDNKYFIKIWFDYPFDTENIDLIDIKNNFIGFKVKFLNEIDDTGRFFVKFISNEIDIWEFT